jgi:hypothetical protein
MQLQFLLRVKWVKKHLLSWLLLLSLLLLCRHSFISWFYAVLCVRWIAIVQERWKCEFSKFYWKCVVLTLLNNFGIVVIICIYCRCEVPRCEIKKNWYNIEIFVINKSFLNYFATAILCTFVDFEFLRNFVCLRIKQECIRYERRKSG